MRGGLKEVESHLRAMTAGDLTTRPEPWGADEAARIGEISAPSTASPSRPTSWR
jgi:hypothetical protein